MPLLTLFTAPKPFTDPHIRLIQTNMLLNWQALGSDLEIVVIGDEPGIAEICKAQGIRHLPKVRTNTMGTPLISSIFDLARQANDSPFLAYANADILFLPELCDVVRLLGEEKGRFLAVGQRYDLEVRETIDFSGDWADRLRKRIQQEGVLHGQSGSDYFIYPRACFQQIPDFAVGRAGWDNWMIYKARREHWSVIDLTGTLTIVHQNHDYAHLPGGIVHFHQPETADNVRIGGGRRTIFRLSDATYQVRSGKLKRKPLTWASFWREVEIFPLVWLHSRLFGWISFAVFHPVKAFGEVKGWAAYKIKQVGNRDGESVG